MVVPYYFKRSLMLEPKNKISWSQWFREITSRLTQGPKGYPLNQVDNVIEEAVMAVGKSSHARQ